LIIFISRVDGLPDDSDFDSGIFRHKVNCCCVLRVCDTCKSTPDAESCPVCGADRKLTFLGDNALDEFCNWLFVKKHRGMTAIAHNSRGFDSQFVLDYLHRQDLKKPKIGPKGEFSVTIMYLI